ncbi:peptide ABC transporter substrate-binding protein [Seongchinamella sediminis]|uniref:Peptide ABC transporter substrate-binding protein n=1 Tax=Seongchinamella sediminis TaxID=2283635 RepID=A0A3L7E4F6_9GAMM|nr:peptide ABC transporter substrate-binding protein [Seongchinamella sediminis]RLQ23381.1 peptide ABC transporter substrate-binding protein [Seongchinamella sediminis]
MPAAGSTARWGPALTAMLLALALAACGDSASNVTAGNRDGVLHFGNGSEPQSIDPHVMSGSPEVNIARALFEGLVTRHPHSMAMVPGVAERWDISADGRVYTFYLNPRACWSNGDPVTAADFHWSLLRSIHPQMGNHLAYTLFGIAGAQDFATGRNNDPESVGIEVVDPQTLRIHLNNPDPYFLSTMGTYPTYPVHRATIEAHGAWTDRFSGWTRLGNIVSNGPFVLSEWQLNRRLEVTRSDTYWDRGNVSLNAVVFHPVESATAEEKMFRAGQLHFTQTVPLSKIPGYQAMANSPYQQHRWQGTYFLQLNTRREPLDDQRVRQALALATDRHKLVDTVLLQTEVPNPGLVPVNTPGYQSPPALDYNPQRARQQLAAAGYPGGAGLPAMEFVFNTSENHRKIAVVLQQMWKEELGIAITLANQEWKVYLDTVNEGDYTISRMGWIAADLNPATYLNILTSESGINRTGFSHARYDEIMLALVPAEADPEKRTALMQEAEAILLDEVPVLPLYTYNSKHLVQPSVKGAPPNVLDLQHYKYISLDPAIPVWKGEDK